MIEIPARLDGQDDTRVLALQTQLAEAQGKLNDAHTQSEAVEDRLREVTEQVRGWEGTQSEGGTGKKGVYVRGR